jgi:hypothetical protein
MSINDGMNSSLTLWSGVAGVRYGHAVADAVRAVGVEVRSRTWGAELVDGGITVEIRQPKIPRYMVTAVEATGPSTLRVTHHDGTCAEHDLAPLITQGGIFAQLSDPTLFKRVYVDHGAVAWPTQLDLGGDTLHDHARGAYPGGCWLDGTP